MKELYMETMEADAFLSGNDGNASAFANDWVVKFESLTMGSIVGTGATGQVLRGKYAGEDVAIKRIYVTGGSSRIHDELPQERHPQPAPSS